MTKKDDFNRVLVIFLYDGLVIKTKGRTSRSSILPETLDMLMRLSISPHEFDTFTINRALNVFDRHHIGFEIDLICRVCNRMLYQIYVQWRNIPEKIEKRMLA